MRGLGVLLLLVACGDGNKDVDSKSQNNSPVAEISKEVDSNVKKSESKAISGEEGKDTGEERNIEKISTSIEVEKVAESKADGKISSRKKSPVKYDGTLPESEEDLIELINAPMEDVSENESATENEDVIDQSEEADLDTEQIDNEGIPVYKMDGKSEEEMPSSEVPAEFNSPMVSEEMSFPEATIESDSPVISEEIPSENQANFNVPIGSEGATPSENVPEFNTSEDYREMSPSENFSESDQSMNFETPTEEVNWAADEQQ